MQTGHLVKQIVLLQKDQLSRIGLRKDRPRAGHLNVYNPYLYPIVDIVMATILGV